jgi:hypothetical protein
VSAGACDTPPLVFHDRPEHCIDALRKMVESPLPWGDVKDEWSAEIAGAFPTRSGSHEEYATAMKMVGHRHSKGELVALVNWLLVRLRAKQD